jgi:hypothetical protein
LNFMKFSLIRVGGLLAIFLFSSCKESESTSAELPATAPDVTEPTPSAQKQVVDEIIRVRAQQQAEGLGGGKVKVHGAWNYTGYSWLAPDPAAAIEARLVAVDLTISGQTPFFDYDDIEIVDGTTKLSYGSDPHIALLTDGGELASPAQVPKPAPGLNRWLLIYGFPQKTESFLLYYWGKSLTPEPQPISPGGLELPYPAAN